MSRTNVRGRLVTRKAANVASASSLVLGSGNLAYVTGTTAIDYISTAQWRAGSIIYLQFAGASGLNHNTGTVPTGYAAVYCAGAASWTAAAGNLAQLVYDGTYWREVSRQSGVLVAGTGLTNTGGTVAVDLSTGKSGGLTITGGTGASENLSIRSTSNATKGAIVVDSAIAAGTTASQNLLLKSTTHVTKGAIVVDSAIAGSTSASENLQLRSTTDSTKGAILVDSTIAAGTTASQTLTLSSTTHGTKGNIVVDSPVAGSTSASGSLTLKSTTDSTKGYIVVDSPIAGSTSASGDLTLTSTTNATKDKIYLGAAQTSYFAEATEDLLITGGFTATGTLATGTIVAGHVRYEAPIAAELISIKADAAMADGAITIAGQPDVPRKLQIRITDGDSSVSAGSIALVGIGPSGEAVSESVTLTGGTATKITTYAYATLTSGIVSGLAGNGAGDNLSIGVGVAMGLPKCRTRALVGVHKECLDGTDETVGTVDTTAGTVAPSHVADGVHNFDFWYSYRL